MAISNIEFKDGRFEVLSPTEGNALRCSECKEKSSYYVTERKKRESSPVYCLECVMRILKEVKIWV